MRVPQHESDNDPWGWFAIILATCLAAVLVFLTEEPPFRGPKYGQQTESGDAPGATPDHNATAETQ